MFLFFYGFIDKNSMFLHTFVFGCHSDAQNYSYQQACVRSGIAIATALTKAWLIKEPSLVSLFNPKLQTLCPIICQRFKIPMIANIFMLFMFECNHII